MPARLRDMKRVFAALGIELEEPRSGDHYKFRKVGLRPFVVPAPNGLKSEIGDKYLRALCRHFDVEVDDVRKGL